MTTTYRVIMRRAYIHHVTIQVEAHNPEHARVVAGREAADLDSSAWEWAFDASNPANGKDVMVAMIQKAQS